jgi:hypothetical protein
MLFKKTLNTDLAEIKHYLSVSQNGSFEKIRPHIASAEILHIKDLLGEALFNRLDQWYNAEDSGSTSASASLSPSIVPSVALFGAFNQMSGAVEMEAEALNEGPDPAFWWYVDDMCVNASEGEPGYDGPVLGNHFNIPAQELADHTKIHCRVDGDLSNDMYVHYSIETGWTVTGVLEEEGSGSIIIVPDLMKLVPSLSLQGSGSTSASVESDAALAALFPLVQRALINFAYYVGADEYSLHITDAGIQIVTDETHKTAFQWQIEAIKSSWLNKAYLFSDVVLVYLESHMAYYPSWVSSDSFTERMDTLLYTTRLFNDAFHIKNSRRLFLALKPIIRSIESKYVAYTLSQEYYDSLLVLLKTSKLTAEDELILKKVRPAIAHLAMSEAITRFSIEIFPEGVYSNLVSSFITSSAKNPAQKFDKSVAIEKLLAEGLAEMQGVQLYLDANASASKYKTYFESSRFVDPTKTPNRSEFVNTPQKGICLI